MARPRAIQGEVEKRLLEALEHGLTIRLACQVAGVSDDTYTEECRRNPGFAETARRARLKHLPEALEQVRKAGRDDWRAAKAFLELVAPDDFGRRLEISGPAGGPIKTVVEVGPERVAAVVSILGGGNDPPPRPDPK